MNKNKKSICIDLDGTLIEQSKWQGLDHFGKPHYGAKEFVEKLSEKFNIIIYTCRCNIQLQKDMGNIPPYFIEEQSIRIWLINKVKNFLDKEGFVYDHIYSGSGKPHAVAYIDDRGLECCPEDDDNLADGFFWNSLLTRIESKLNYCKTIE